jgi:hypothetical protein
VAAAHAATDGVAVVPTAAHFVVDAYKAAVVDVLSVVVVNAPDDGVPVPIGPRVGADVAFKAVKVPAAGVDPPMGPGDAALKLPPGGKFPLCPQVIAVIHSTNMAAASTVTAGDHPQTFFMFLMRSITLPHKLRE